MESLDGKQAHKRNRREVVKGEIEDFVNRIWGEYGIN
jgi:hypothetical protein